MPARLLVAAALFGLLAAGSPLASGSTTSVTVTVDRTSFTGTWHEGWFGIWQTRVIHHLGRSDVVWKRVGNGSLIVGGTVSEAAELEVSVRSSSGKVVNTSTFSVPAGRYRASLKLGRPLPGPYMVTTRAVGPNDTTLKQVAKQVEFPPPLEGVADRASISSSRTGPGVKVIRNRHEAWARFHFLVKPPSTDTVYIEWRQPDWVHVCQTPTGPAKGCKLEKRPIPADGLIYTFLRSSAKLQTGRWYCQMSVKSGSRYIVARRTFVTIR